MRVAIVGSGYVGLVSGACLADFGHDITCIDRDEHRIAELRSGLVPIYEPGLAELIAANVAEGRLRFDTRLDQAVAAADIVVIAVGTPASDNDEADLSSVHAAAKSIGLALDGFTLVVTKSTVPVGTGDAVASAIHAARPDAVFDVVSNPEFLREGAAIKDFCQPERIVVGAETERARALMSELYRPLTQRGTALFMTTRRSAELLKYAANAFLAMKISFINEMADLCEKAGGDIADVARGIGLDSRIGPKFLEAGPGYGGSCFPKDTRALAAMGRRYEAPQRLVEATIAVNAERFTRMARRIVEACGGSVEGRRIALLGLTFKPGTDDMRESPALGIAEALIRAGARISAYDPQAAAGLAGLALSEDAYAAATGADCLVLATEWREFRALDMARIRDIMAQPVIVDLRNLFDARTMRALGFEYRGIGRPALDVDTPSMRAAE
ncbi:UDP-glucose 6-dehydrogenase [Devosia pacifica]|uniref:UDP-glucose 6-dehydrogenase n=1 Tax=Devosia pacifica TaxID=1335967 RepID=A0A918S5N8_9HYPH|nr:UDP-glucose/GDP-mannose dehydrogenase family protein [Devosia pacifica]GHA25448.1 UDP-glucose 6-dehydrogenase [Devosia pacifica]